MTISLLNETDYVSAKEICTTIINFGDNMENERADNIIKSCENRIKEYEFTINNRIDYISYYSKEISEWKEKIMELKEIISLTEQEKERIEKRKKKCLEKEDENSNE